MKNYLGISNKVNHENELTIKYNKLLDLIGIEGMLIQFERFIDDQDLKDLLKQIECNLSENNI